MPIDPRRLRDGVPPAPAAPGALANVDDDPEPVEDMGEVVGSMTCSWTMGGGSIGRRSATRRTHQSASVAANDESCTFPADTAHPGLFWFLAYYQIIDPATTGIVRNDDGAVMELRDGHDGFVEEGEGSDQITDNDDDNSKLQ